MCQNRVMFKQFLQAGGLQYCQIDACRLGGVNEVLAVILMAAKFNGGFRLYFSFFNPVKKQKYSDMSDGQM